MTSDDTNCKGTGKFAKGRLGDMRFDSCLSTRTPLSPSATKSPNRFKSSGAHACASGPGSILWRMFTKARALILGALITFMYSVAAADQPHKTENIFLIT